MNDLRVIKALAEITREMREAGDAKGPRPGTIDRARVATHAHKSPDMVREFEKGEQAPHIDPMVNAIAKDAGMEPADLWMRAIARAAMNAGAPAGKAARFASDELGDVADQAGLDGAALDEPAPQDGEGPPPKQSH